MMSLKQRLRETGLEKFGFQRQITEYDYNSNHFLSFTEGKKIPLEDY